MKLYITDMSLFVLAVFYLPLVLWLLQLKGSALD
jgi:hypothetical protein